MSLDAGIVLQVSVELNLINWWSWFYEEEGKLRLYVYDPLEAMDS